MPPHTRSNMMGDTHSDGVDRGVGTSNSVPENEFTSMMSKMMADLKNELKVSTVAMIANYTSFHEEIVAMKEACVSRSVTPKSDHIHRKASGVERVVARGNRGHVGKGYGMNGDGRYVDYKCYGGYSWERHGRDDYKSRYHDDGLDRGSRREQVPKPHGELHRRNNGENDRHKGFERPFEEGVPYRARMGLSIDIVVVTQTQRVHHQGVVIHPILSNPEGAS